MRKLLMAAGVALAAFFGSAGSAESAFEIRYSLDGGANFGASVADGSGGDGNAAPGLIQFNIPTLGVTVNASATGTTSVTSTLLDLQVQGIVNAGPYNLVVQGSLTGLLTAPPPLKLTNKFSDASFPGGGNTRTWIDDNNNLYGGAGGAGILDIKLDTGVLGPNAPVGVQFIFVANTAYSITTQISIAGTSDGSDSLSLDSNNRIVPTPAPVGLVLALTGLPVFGLRALVRRRRS